MAAAGDEKRRGQWRSGGVLSHGGGRPWLTHLVKDDISRRVEFFHICCRLGCHSEAERNVVHVVHHHAGVLRSVVGHAADASFVDIVSVEK